MKRSLILESEKKEILSKHIKTPPINLKEVVISEWLSPDERYIIFLDELYDIKNKTKLGDIWKSPDNLILFLEHTFRVSKLKKDIKEHAQNTFNNILNKFFYSGMYAIAKRLSLTIFNKPISIY